MTPVYWWLVEAEDLPPEAHWLSEAERVILGGLRFPKRRQEWLLGRWAAKGLVLRHRQAYFAARAEARLHEVEIIAAADGAPEVYVRAQRLPLTLSISHRAGVAVAMIVAADISMGCDLELIEPRSALFVGDYFTVEEQTWLMCWDEPERILHTALVWSAKESALKAARVGLRRDTRSVHVHVPAEQSISTMIDRWEPLDVHDRGDNRMYRGFWRLLNTSSYVQYPPYRPAGVRLHGATAHQRLVLTMVANPPVSVPSIEPTFPPTPMGTPLS